MALRLSSLQLNCSVSCGISVLQPETEPASPAVQGGSLTTGPPQKCLDLGFDWISAAPWPLQTSSCWVWRGDAIVQEVRGLDTQRLGEYYEDSPNRRRGVLLVPSQLWRRAAGSGARKGFLSSCPWTRIPQGCLEENVNAINRIYKDASHGERSFISSTHTHTNFLLQIKNRAAVFPQSPRGPVSLLCLSPLHTLLTALPGELLRSSVCRGGDGWWTPSLPGGYAHVTLDTQSWRPATGKTAQMNPRSPGA